MDNDDQIDLAAVDNEYYCNHWREITAGCPMVGPFTAQQSGLSGYSIVGGDGVVAIWVMGEENARCVAGLMNFAYEHGLVK